MVFSSILCFMLTKVLKVNNIPFLFLLVTWMPPYSANLGDFMQIMKVEEGMTLDMWVFKWKEFHVKYLSYYGYWLASTRGIIFFPDIVLKLIYLFPSYMSSFLFSFFFDVTAGFTFVWNNYTKYFISKEITQESAFLNLKKTIPFHQLLTKM